MKKVILFAVALAGFAMSAQAQDENLRFGSRQNNDAIEDWKYVADNNRKDEHDWAVAVYREFPLSGAGEIQHRYVINATDSFSVSALMELTKAWLEKAFAVSGDSIQCDLDRHVVRTCVHLKGLGDAYGFGGFSATSSEAHVTIPLELTFQFKDNRLRFCAVIPSFILDSSDWVKDVVNKSMPVTECYPVNPKSKHKDSFSRAFINANAKCLTSCRDYINYLNTHFGEKPRPQLLPKKSADDDW